jgi:hypothetical protein
MKKNTISCKFILLFLWILCLIGSPGITLSASDHFSVTQCSFCDTAPESHGCIEIEAPVQDNPIDNVIKVKPNTGKIILHKDSVNDYIIILSNSEFLNKLQTAYHRNIDGLYSYLVQRIII